MGFSGIPPRADLGVLLQAIDLWSLRADAAIMSAEPPWDSLLAGVRPDSLVMRQQLGLANLYRGKGHRVWVYLDPGNGLNRGGDSDPLVAAGRSITEPAIQQLYRAYAVAMDTLIRPDVFGVALETNLIRAASPPALYAAIRQAANGAAADIRAHDPAVRLSASVQVETAWGLLPAVGGFPGVATDFADFPFVEVLGLSSYPYFAWAAPESLPLDYYSRLVDGRSTPVAVVEGGWTSASLDTTVVSSADAQRRYIARQVALLDRAHAIGLFQLTFTDLDLAGVALPPGSILPLFAHLGLVDSVLTPKPALAEWDAAFARPRR